jgi:hypothetical protein
VQKLSIESSNILKDNYDSIVYSKNMFIALDDMKNAFSNNIGVVNQKSNELKLKIFEFAKIEFDKNLKDEGNNITEINEKEYVNSLKNDYSIFLGLIGKFKTGKVDDLTYSEFQQVYVKLRQDIININDINMQAVVRKNQIAKKDSSNIISYLAIIGTVCLILAFGYFWYFPFYISNSISYLSDKMKELIGKAGFKLDIRSDDETHIILQSINLLENNLNPDNKDKSK